MQTFLPSAVYILCFLTSSACALLLGRSYRQSGARLLLWSTLCFAFLAANHLLLVIDLLVYPDIDLRLGRLLLSSAAVGILIFGFVWDLDKD
ncbi:MAG TPA: DUF5985 family protein [Sphingomicrobium sp.]|nr:DUF5985 family protein [Sphingomicrobium sp.]